MLNFSNKYKILIFSLVIAILGTSVFSEQFRIANLHTVSITNEIDSEASAILELNDAVAIFLPEERPFMEGLEIKMTIPEEMAIWRDCSACVIYDSLNQVPAEGQIDYNGQKSFFGVIPGKLSWYLHIPFVESEKLKTNQYTTKMENIPNLSDNYIFLRLQQIMKGMPDSVLESKVTVNIKPIFANKGILTLNIKDNSLYNDDFSEDDEENTDNTDSESFYSVYIDDIPQTGDLSQIFLETGIHNISVISEDYRTEVRTVRIEQAKITSLDIFLKSIEPTVFITSPEGTEIFFDEEPFLDIGKEVVVTEGEHKVKFIIGDYEIVRSITVIKGKTYKVNLAVDLQISEE